MCVLLTTLFFTDRARELYLEHMEKLNKLSSDKEEPSSKRMKPDETSVEVEFTSQCLDYILII